MQGHIGSVVRPQAAENLIPTWLSQRRTEAALGEVAERHIKLIVTRLLDFYIKNVNMLMYCVVLGEKSTFYER